MDNRREVRSGYTGTAISQAHRSSNNSTLLNTLNPKGGQIHRKIQLKVHHTAMRARHLGTPNGKAVCRTIPKEMSNGSLPWKVTEQKRALFEAKGW